MKKYTRRSKPEKVSKRMLVARMRAAQAAAFVSKHEALEFEESLKTARTNLEMEFVRSAGYRREADKLREELEKLTRPVWRYAQVYRNPPEEYESNETPARWSVEGSCHVAFRADFRGVQHIPLGDREAFLERLVEDFTHKAREHAKKSFRVLVV